MKKVENGFIGFFGRFFIKRADFSSGLSSFWPLLTCSKVSSPESISMLTKRSPMSTTCEFGSFKINLSDVVDLGDIFSDSVMSLETWSVAAVDA